MAEKKVPFSADWGANLVRTEAWTDDNRILVESTQDCSAIAKLNKHQSNELHHQSFGTVTKSNVVKAVAAGQDAYIGPFKQSAFNDPNNKAWRCGGGWV